MKTFYTECDSRVLTPAAPWAEIWVSYLQKQVQPLIFHHRIARELLIKKQVYKANHKAVCEYFEES